METWLVEDLSVRTIPSLSGGFAGVGRVWDDHGACACVDLSNPKFADKFPCFPGLWRAD